MSYNYRCSDRANCGARKTLKRMIEHYVRRPMCPGCKRMTLVHDPAVRRQTSKRTCYCDGMEGGWPHRHGTEPWCVHAKVGPTDEDYQDRYGRL